MHGNKAFGPRLRALRESLGVDRHELARKLEIGYGWLSKVENNDGTRTEALGPETMALLVQNYPEAEPLVWAELDKLRQQMGLPNRERATGDPHGGYPLADKMRAACGRMREVIEAAELVRKNAETSELEIETALAAMGEPLESPKRRRRK